MGADLIGYFMYVPQKLTDKEKKIIKAVRDEIAELNNPPTISKIFNDSKSPEFKKFGELLPTLEEEYYNDGFEYEQDLIEALKEAVETIDKYAKEEFYIGEFRDLAFDLINIYNRPVLVGFAGDMSWGDTPEGAGYRTMEEIWRCGLGTLFGDFALSPKPKSLRFLDKVDTGE